MLRICAIFSRETIRFVLKNEHEQLLVLFASKSEDATENNDDEAIAAKAANPLIKTKTVTKLLREISKTMSPLAARKSLQRYLSTGPDLKDNKTGLIHFSPLILPVTPSAEHFLNGPFIVLEPHYQEIG